MGTINFDFNFWTLSLLLMNFSLAVFVAVTNHSKAAAEELKAVKNALHTDMADIGCQVAAQGQRLARIESDIDNSITKDDLAAVHRRMDPILETVRLVQGQLTEMSNNMGRMDGHLMQILHHSNKGQS